MANIAAARLYKLQPHAAIYVCTFAGARAGDADFAAAYDAAVTNSDRYEFADDIVPHLPPMDALRALAKHLPMKDRLPEIAARIDAFPEGYVSVGNLHFIEWDGTIVPESTILEIERIASLMKVFGDCNSPRLLPTTASIRQIRPIRLTQAITACFTADPVGVNRLR
jgi:Lipase (class 3)